jgi:adenylate cyclase
LALKGFREPVQAYRVAALAEGGRARGLPGILAPLIGRERPLATLREAFQKAANNLMRVVCIIGEPGVGKTRLIDEFLSSLGAGDARIVRGRCLDVARTQPLLPVAELLRDLLQIDLNDPPDAALAAVRAFAEAHPAVDDPTPYLANIFGVAGGHTDLEQRLSNLDDAMLQRQTHTMVRQMLLEVARHAPLIVAIDDVHWIDSASRELLEYLMASCRDSRMLLLIASRNGDQHALAAGEDVEVERIELQPLSQQELRLLARQLIPGDALAVQRLRQRIVARSEGNPFYLEEIVRMLLDYGALQIGDGACRLTVDDPELMLQDVPPTLRGLLITRFDALEPELRRVAQRAAVLGRAFPIRLLRTVLDAKREEIVAALDELERRRFLQQQAFGLEKGYTFCHALTQEAIHSTILKRERRELHRKIASAIESGWFAPPAERNEALAFHWSESSTPKRAAPYLVASAEYSSRRYANDAAAELCRRALGILAEVPDRRLQVRALLVDGRALKFLGRLPEARRSLQGAIDLLLPVLSTEEADAAQVKSYAEVLRELADVNDRAGALDEAAARLDEALLLAHQVADAFDQRDPADPALMASAYNTIGGVLWYYGKLSAAEGYVRQSLAMYHRIGYLFGKANAHTNLGILCYAEGKWKESEEHFERSDFIRRETGCLVGRSTNLLNLGMLHLATGDHDRAQADIETSLRVSHQLGEEIDTIRGLIGLAHLAVTRGHFAEAERTIAQIWAKPLQSIPKADRAQAQMVRSLVVANNGALNEAIRIATEACETAHESGVPDTEADCARTLGVLRLRAGDAVSAEQWLRRSLEQARSVGDPYREGLALLELGIATARLPGHKSESAHLIEEAANLFTRLGAAHDAGRALDALQDRLDAAQA